MPYRSTSERDEGVEGREDGDSSVPMAAAQAFPAPAPDAGDRTTPANPELGEPPQTAAPPRAHGQIAEVSDAKILLQNYLNAREVYFAEDPVMLLLKLQFRDPPCHGARQSDIGPESRSKYLRPPWGCILEWMPAHSRFLHSCLRSQDFVVDGVGRGAADARVLS